MVVKTEKERSLSSHFLAGTDNLTSNNQKTEHIQTQTNATQKASMINSKNALRKPMLREDVV